MIQSSDILEYDIPGFDGEKYIQLQAEAIQDRIDKFSGKLYLEIWGKFLYDPHASRVLPGFYPDSKRRIFKSLAKNADVIFCVNAKDIKKKSYVIKYLIILHSSLLRNDRWYYYKIMNHSIYFNK